MFYFNQIIPLNLRFCFETLYYKQSVPWFIHICEMQWTFISFCVSMFHLCTSRRNYFSYSIFIFALTYSCFGRYWDEISSLKHWWCLLYNGSLRSTYLLFAKFSKNLFSIFFYFGWLCLRCFICCSFVSPLALLSIYCCHSNFSGLRSDNSVFCIVASTQTCKLRCHSFSLGLCIMEFKSFMYCH